MRTVPIIMLTLLLSTSALMATCGMPHGDDAVKHADHEMKAEAHAEYTHMHMPLNNVVKIDDEGKRTALCGCGMEINVDDKTVFYKDDKLTFWACGDNCKNMMANATDEERTMMMGAWHTKFAAYELADNTFMKDDVLMAKCACGAEIVVDDKTLKVVENGMKVYCCGPGCHDMFTAMNDDKRLEVEIKAAMTD